MEWGFLGEGTSVIRLAARIDEATADKLETMKHDAIEAARNPLILNAVPVAQMQSLAEDLLLSPFKTESGYAQPFTAVWGTFAATVRETSMSPTGVQTIYPAAGMQVMPVEFAARRQDEQNAEITCGLPSSAAQEYQARLYFGTRGE